MSAPVTLPIWLFVLILLFAAISASTHLLFPSVRWFFRRRAERIVSELNKRLERPIQPFKLLRRQDMIQRVIYDPDVVRQVGAYAEEHDVREDVAFEKARDYAREIVPSFSATAYYAVAIRLSRWVANKLFEVRLHQVDEAALSEIDPEATVVYVMNHRSNFDYVLVTYLAAKQSTLSYAVGEWARVWPLSRLIRAMGAYFIRRRSRGALYRKVLSSYVQKATEAGVTQAVFPEGGLSRDGTLGAPKLGILSYIVESWDSAGRDVVFVPVSLNYDRVVEDRVLVAAGRTGKQRFRGSIMEGVQFGLRYIWRRIRGKVGRFGEAGVVFGRPLSLRSVVDEVEGDRVSYIADALFAKIRDGLPVMTVPLLLSAIVSLGRPASLEEIVAEARAMLAQVGDETVIFGDKELAESGVENALRILVLRGFLDVEGGTYRIIDPDVVGYYANSMAGHLSADFAQTVARLRDPEKSEKT